MDIKTISVARLLTEQAVGRVLGGSPEAIEAMKNLANKLNDDPAFIETITTKVDGKLDAEEGKVLIPETDAEKLALLPSIVEIGSGLKLQDGVLIGTSDVVADVDNKTLVTDESGLLAVKVATNGGLIVTDEGISMALASENSPGALSPEHFVVLQQMSEVSWNNVIEGALIGNNQAQIDEDHNLIIPVGGDLLGVVKSTDENNGVNIATDGTMEINRISTSKLFVEEGDELIFDCGSADTTI